MIIKEGKTNTTIICIHGNSGSHKHFECLLDPKIEHNIILLDLPGHGGDTQTSGQDDYSITNYKKFIQNAISKINGEIVLIGHSYGGHLAMEIAPDIELLKGIILFGAPPVKMPINMEEAFLPFPHLPLFFTPELDENQIDNLLSSLIVDQSKSEIVKNDFETTNPLVRAQAGVELTTLTHISNEHQLLTDLNCKKLILNGENDPVVNGQYLSDIKSECNFELINVKDCGHYISLEKPEIFKEQVIQFCN